MKSKDKIVEQLKQILFEDKILTDLEDRYVYSFEKIFLNKLDTQPDIIVRVSSLSEENKIKRFFEREDAILIERGQFISNTNNRSSKILVLLDNVPRCVVPKIPLSFAIISL